MKVDLCSVGDIPPGGALEVEFFGRSLQVVLADDGTPVAYANVCMHFGGPLECDEDGHLRCRWHGARFSRDTGARIDGPAAPNTRLMRLSTVVEDGMLRYVWADAR